MAPDGSDPWDLRSETERHCQEVHEAGLLMEEACELLLQASEEHERSENLGENDLSRGGVLALHEQLLELMHRDAAFRRRVVFIGRSGVGKTNLFNSLLRASEPDLEEYCARVQEKIAQFGEWDELALVDATPHETPRLDTVAAARAGARVEVYFPGEDQWREGEVVDVSESDDGTTHSILFNGDEEAFTGLSLRDHEVPEGGSTEAVWARKVWDLRFAEERPEAEPGYVGGNYYLLPEGDVSDTTLVGSQITSGSTVRVWIYFKNIAEVAEAIGSLGKLRNEMRAGAASTSGTVPCGMDIDGTIEIGDSVEKGAPEDEHFWDPWMQNALALIGKPLNFPILDLKEDDFVLPGHFRSRLSAAGKVEIFSPCQSTSPDGTPYGGSLLSEHVKRAAQFIESRTGEGLHGDSHKKIYWPLVERAVIQLPHRVVRWHDFTDLPGVSKDPGPFSCDAREEIRKSDLVIFMMDVRRDQQAAMPRLAETAYLCDRHVSDGGDADQEKRIAVVCAGDKWWTKRNAKVHSTARVPNHEQNTPAERKILLEAERKWASDRKRDVAAALEDLMISRENLPKHVAEQRANDIANRVTFLVIYPDLRHNPECVKDNIGNVIYQYQAISEEDSRMPQLRDFLRSGRVRAAGTRDARALVSAARELLGRFEEMGARTFALARAVKQPTQLERLKNALERASAPRALKLPTLRTDVLDGVERELRENRRESVEACTPLRFGKELSRLVIHSSKEPGKVQPSLFTGDLQQALYLGPATPLVETMECDGVRLQDLMIAPFLLHPTECLYRALGIEAVGDRGTDAAAEKAPIWDLVAEFLEGCARALVCAGAEALQDLGQDVKTGGRELLDQLIRCHVDAIVARHLGALRAMRVFEVIRRAAEQTIASQTARLCARVKRGKQKMWGPPSRSGQKSKMMSVEEACRRLAELGMEKEIELFMMRLKPTFSNIRVDLRNLPHQLDPRELLTLIKPARLAARASLLARSQSLQTRFARLLDVERGSEEGKREPEREEGDGREWTLIETRDLLACLNGVDNEGSAESALERVLGDPHVREAAAGRSLATVLAYVRLLEGCFGAAEQGGLRFAEKSYEAAVRAREKCDSGRDALRKGLPEEYVREDTDILRLLKAVTQFYQRSRATPTLRARTAADREIIAGILNRAQARQEAKESLWGRKARRSDLPNTTRTPKTNVEQSTVKDEKLPEKEAGSEIGDQSGAGTEETPLGSGCAGQRFVKQIWDDTEGTFVVKRGIILRGPLASGARMVTRQSVFEVRYDGGQTGKISLRPEERKSGTYRKEDSRPLSGSARSAEQPPGEEDSGNKDACLNGNANGSGRGSGDESSSGNGKENEHDRYENGSGTAPKPWQALEVGWCLERLCALYGASPDAFRTALRDYEASALPDGVRIEYKPRKTGDRVDKYYIYGDSLVKLQQFFDGEQPMARGEERGRGCGARPHLTPAQKSAVLERMEEEGWPNYTSERQEGRTAGKVDSYYKTPQGKRFRSLVEVYDYLEKVDEAREEQAASEEEEDRPLCQLGSERKRLKKGSKA
ncbi:hypothetical protein KFL_002410130 [Klebsormidium nitens]|uniref:MBD domain-containing protein n=1 Tax=Klebsormidium nitens TaxID=105231 RepID=A0A1Y1I6I3_KLENI|nr:hypothetical protein KFL_002410130 [Klebsormidium nitens]|eukprot:GAQ85562.1 hypothetical protein KFL_002410130 [Klebsormidium nitens]